MDLDLMDLGSTVFVFAELRSSPSGGFEPDLPTEVRFTEVATPHRKARWRLYECSLEPRDPRSWSGVTTVPKALEDLLIQARNHPRAVMLARARAMEHLGEDAPTLVDRDSFAALFAGFLQEALATPAVAFELDFEPLGPGD